MLEACGPCGNRTLMSYHLMHTTLSILLNAEFSKYICKTQEAIACRLESQIMKPLSRCDEHHAIHLNKIVDTWDTLISKTHTTENFASGSKALEFFYPLNSSLHPEILIKHACIYRYHTIVSMLICNEVCTYALLNKCTQSNWAFITYKYVSNPWSSTLVVSQSTVTYCNQSLYR